MSKLPVVSGQEVIKALAKIGFVHMRTTGSHAILRKSNPAGDIVVPVPLHKELAKGTLLSIMHQVKLRREDFILLIGGR
ncbi:MAG TPA: type II toxin-antitoxin system HicA family toxin [Candidatus Nanoarchaeia archaeon]|nr:type II toxin-antitoxin system HicA family toxin [Candidatus Nanoarchaeia archaeon]